MSYPFREDVPDDIKVTTENVSRLVGAIHAIDAIADALMAERERCARIADDYDTGWTRFGPNIAAAIRSPAKEGSRHD